MSRPIAPIGFLRSPAFHLGRMQPAMRRFSGLQLMWLAAVVASFGLAIQSVAEEAVDYQRQIRPLLADKCLACHGADSEQREGAIRGGESGKAAIEPGMPDASELISRIEATDPDVQMPPASSKKQLTADEKKLLRRWISEGANYKAHWAF